MDKTMRTTTRILPLALAGLVIALGAQFAGAQAIREADDALSARAFDAAELRVQSENALLSDAASFVSSETDMAWQAFAAGKSAPWVAYVDKRSGRIDYAEGGNVAWIPGAGNRLRRRRQGHSGDPRDARPPAARASGRHAGRRPGQPRPQCRPVRATCGPPLVRRLRCPLRRPQDRGRARRLLRQQRQPDLFWQREPPRARYPRACRPGAGRSGACHLLRPCRRLPGRRHDRRQRHLQAPADHDREQAVRRRLCARQRPRPGRRLGVLVPP